MTLKEFKQWLNALPISEDTVVFIENSCGSKTFDAGSNIDFGDWRIESDSAGTRLYLIND